MEAVGQLTGGVAHDFNNLLAVILGNLELIEGHIGDNTRVGAMIDRGIRVAERGAALTDRLLAFSRKQTLLPSVVDFNVLIDDTEELLRRSLGEQIEICIVRRADLWPNEVDQSQLDNALLNLSNNARDAMPMGGRLTIETANISLNDETAAQKLEVDPGRYTMLSISDTGSVIPVEVLDHVFEPFFTTKDVGKGSVLGLSMVHGFAKQSGGGVTIDSEPEAGTTVKLFLPASGANSAAAVALQESPETPTARGETALLVEDDPDVRTLAVSLLMKLGYDVLDAEAAEPALEILISGADIDLLLTDIVLPGAMNGPDLATVARRRKLVTRYLFITGYAKNFLDTDGDPLGDTRIIQKPFRKSEFAKAVRQALDKEAAPV